jgi:hypothetical protein
VQGVLQVFSLAGSISSGADDDPFQVRTGYLNANGVTFQYTPVSAAGALHGLLRTAAEYKNSVTIDVAVNAYESPATVVAGGVAFDPIAAGSTTVSASAIGFNNLWSGATATIQVTP